LDGLVDIKSKEAFSDVLPMLSHSSKKYFTLSSNYFDALQKGNVQMIDDLQTVRHPPKMTLFYARA